MIIRIRNLSYKERLKSFGMFSLRCRRLKGGMIEVFKMIYGIDKLNLEKFFFVQMRMKGQENSLFKNLRRHVNSNIGFNLNF